MIEQVYANADRSFFWIDVTDPKKKELVQLAKDHGMHPRFVQDCMDPEHLPKFEQIGGTSFIILRSYDDQCIADADEVTELTRKIALFATKNFLLTVHSKPQKFITDLKNKWRDPASAEEGAGRGEISSSAIVFDLLSEALRTYEAPIEVAYDELDKIEVGIVEAQNLKTEVLKSCYYLKRRSSVFKRMLRLSGDVLTKVNSAYFGAQSVATQDLKENLDSLVFFVDELVDNTNNLLNLHISLSSQRTNEVMRVLTVFSLFFLPLNFIASIYGMNFEHMPELRWVWGYPSALATMILVAIGIGFWFRKKHWL